MGRLLYEADERVNTENLQQRQSVYILAAKARNGDGARMIVSDYRGTAEMIELEVSGMENAKEVSATIMDDKFDCVPAKVIWNGSKLTLVKNCSGSAAFYVTMR